MLQRITADRRFALVDLALVLLSGAIGIVKPMVGFWFLPIALLPWIIRVFAGKSPFQRTSFDLPIFVFLLTTAGSYFAAYDCVAAFEKFLFLLLSVLLYYALCSQPSENFTAIAVLWFVVGAGVSVYYFLTHDFVNNPKGIALVNALGEWFMEVRPNLAWQGIPSGHLAGWVVLTALFVIYPLARPANPPGRLFKLAVLGGLGLVCLGILATQSSSLWVSLLGATGTWLVWKLFTGSGRLQHRARVFPWIVFGYLALVTAFIYAFGPAASANPNTFGSNSRLEVFLRSAYFLLDFPISGAGLASFPGLYSQYMLGIPYFYFPNSYNVFLDVAIEQGWLGGAAFLAIYLAGIFLASKRAGESNPTLRRWLALFILMFGLLHGLMQDYLYHAGGTMLLFFPVAMSILLGRDRGEMYEANAQLRATPGRVRLYALSFVGLMLVGGLLGYDRLRSVWYSNLGAVQLAQVELAGFPESGWPGVGIIPRLKDAETSLRTSLRFDPENLTANYRLGLILMLRRDFGSASHYLELAYAEAPNHRGIKKALGYSYLWTGELGKAQACLAEIPEAPGELDAYYWWWKNQNRVDLSNNAYRFLVDYTSVQNQP